MSFGRINIMAFQVIVSVLILYFAYFSWIPFSRYADDIVALIFAVITTLNFVKGGRFSKVNSIIFVLLIIMTGVGLVSNLLSGINRTLGDILNALFSFWRIFFVYLGMSSLLYKHKNRRDLILQFSDKLAKIFIILSFVFMILNIIGIVDMSNTVRYGIKNFAFYFGNPSQYGVFLGAALAVIILKGDAKSIYEVLAIITLISTAKGMSLIIAATYVCLYIIANRKAIEWWKIILVVLILGFVLQFQIRGYLLNNTAPRAILIRRGFETATNFFPFGAGFGTYGSNVAASHYSPLYTRYGFPARKALSGYLEDGKTYLNDAYLAMILGEFGYIGTMIWGYVIFAIGKILINKKTLNRKAQNITVACFACMCGMMIMAGSVKNAPGEILMIIFALFCSNEDEYDEKERKKGFEIGNEKKQTG